VSSYGQPELLKESKPDWDTAEIKTIRLICGVQQLVLECVQNTTKLVMIVHELQKNRNQ